MCAFAPGGLVREHLAQNRPMTLRFQFEPSPAAADLLEVAFDLTIDTLREDQEYLDRELLPDTLPRTAAMTGPSQIITTLEALRAVLWTEESVGLTEYHWLMLYEMLDYQFVLWNDDLKGGPDTTVPRVVFESDDELWIEAGPPLQLDLHAFIDNYFWDDDFLIAPEEFAALTPARKVLLNLTDSTFSVIHGYPPHPEDLELRVGEEHR